MYVIYIYIYIYIYIFVVMFMPCPGNFLAPCDTQHGLGFSVWAACDVQQADPPRCFTNRIIHIDPSLQLMHLRITPCCDSVASPPYG
jgi:hypothetical protein